MQNHEGGQKWGVDGDVKEKERHLNERMNPSKSMKSNRVSRSQVIRLEEVGAMVEVYNGRIWVKVRPVPSMVVLKYGEMAKTRTPRQMNKKKR